MNGARTSKPNVSTPLSLRLYALAAGAASPIAPLLLRRRALRGKEDLARLGERLGVAGVARPDGVLVWLHGASVGETLSLLPLIEAFAAERPELGLLATSGTITSAELMARRLPAGAIHHYIPIDTPAATHAFLDHWRPDLGVFVEGELWPNLLLAAKARGTRLALLSAKLSPASFRNWRRARGAARRLFGVFDLILARDAAAARRLGELGVRVDGLADLKYGAAPLPFDETVLRIRRDGLGERPVILAASTHPGEDEVIIQAFAPIRDAATAPLLVIVPRHPDRGAAIAERAAAMGLRAARQQAGQSFREAEVFVADRLGELGLWFRLTRLAIMGGSFLPGFGGHNPLEPARLGAPIVFGRHVDNWSAVYGDLAEAGAGIRAEDAEQLARVIRRALADDQALPAMARAAKAFADAGDHAARAIPARVMALLP